MSSVRNTSAGVPRDGRRPPFVGALLRIAYQETRARSLRALEEQGFGDLNQALLNVMVYPHPDGVRPSELAKRTNMTKQAMNYLLLQLEALGYIERRAENGDRRRLVFLTRRGWQVVDTMRAAVKQIEAEWTAILGVKRFEQFMDMLRQLSAIGAVRGQPDSQRSTGAKELTRRRARSSDRGKT
jgi:DNA-binding MarR family transcriptional regulator